jgi:hypothetical protein
LRNCDDCTVYHLGQLREHRATRAEIHETLVLIVGGSALIPRSAARISYGFELEGEPATAS